MADLYKQHPLKIMNPFCFFWEYVVKDFGIKGQRLIVTTNCMTKLASKKTVNSYLAVSLADYFLLFFAVCLVAMSILVISNVTRVSNSKTLNLNPVKASPSQITSQKILRLQCDSSYQLWFKACGGASTGISLYLMRFGGCFPLFFFFSSKRTVSITCVGEVVKNNHH